jgi:hypothetical protein
VPDTPTLAVSADPEAIQAAMEALAAYREAESNLAKVDAVALRKLEAARLAYAKTIGKAQAELDAARQEAERRGVVFPGGGPRSSAGRPKGRTRSTIGVDEARARLPAGEFTRRELAEVLGCSEPKAKRLLDVLEANGSVSKVGTRPSGSGRGRAAVTYRAA